MSFSKTRIVMIRDGRNQQLALLGRRENLGPRKPDGRVPSLLSLGYGPGKPSSGGPSYQRQLPTAHPGSNCPAWVPPNLTWSPELSLNKVELP